MKELSLKILDWILFYGLKIIIAVAIFVVGRWIANIIRHSVEKVMTKSNIDQTLVKFTGNMVYWGLSIFVIIAALGQLGVQTTSFVAIIGAAGLAVGLALQGSLANFAAGVLMIIFKPFKVGDFIDAAGTAGVVEEIQIFNTQLKTPDNKQIIIPNANITSGNITNFSAKEIRRIDLVFGVSYEAKIEHVKRVLQEILDQDERILKDPAYKIALSELADSSINFVVRPWVKSADYWDVYFHLNETVKNRFDEENISIPYPQQDVHIIKNGDGN